MTSSVHQQVPLSQQHLSRCHTTNYLTDSPSTASLSQHQYLSFAPRIVSFMPLFRPFHCLPLSRSRLPHYVSHCLTHLALSFKGTQDQHLLSCSFLLSLRQHRDRLDAEMFAKMNPTEYFGEEDEDETMIHATKFARCRSRPCSAEEKQERNEREREMTECVSHEKGIVLF